MMGALVTGGLGFVGSNLSRYLLEHGCQVIIVDNQSRVGGNYNLEWLSNLPHIQRSRLEVVTGDIRDPGVLLPLAKRVEVIYHLAGQVAATVSIANPRFDFEVNVIGTFNVLEAARLAGHKPAVFYTSSNKVYGSLKDIPLEERETHWVYADGRKGIREDQPLDFHTPYGCSKGAAEQYVRDYARIFEIPTVVFRMSAIYGPHQFPTEGQGWLAYFATAAVLDTPIRMFGKGKQVRDVLFIDDLVQLFLLATERINDIRGEIFNVGGGPENTLSIIELQGMLEERYSRAFRRTILDERPGDQRLYISDITKISQACGWQPNVEPKVGVARMCDWIEETRALFDWSAIEGV